MDNPAEALRLTPERCPGRCVYQDAQVVVHIHGGMAFLFFKAVQAAGAIGQAQGESLLKALQALEKEPLHSLQLYINSAGANFHEPLNGLFYLNAFLERLWVYRAKGIRIYGVSTGWLYGGMAMALAAVAHEVILGPSANMGLLGKRVISNQMNSVIPVNSFQPEHLKLTRVFE